MARDEVLYTGATSASFSKTRREKENEEKLVQQSKIIQGADVIQELIAKERQAISYELGNLVQVDTKPEDLKSILIGLQTADRRLLNLQQNILRILNAKPRRRVNNDV